MSKKRADFNEHDPLEPIKGETRAANLALQDYALMGGRRSMRQLRDRYRILGKAYTADPVNNTKPPTVRLTTMSNWSITYRWQDRVAVYDEIVRKRSQDEFETQRNKWRENRMKAAQGLLGKAVEALTTYNPARSSLSEITRAIQVAHDELRLEFGEEDQLKAQDVVITIKREERRADAEDD